MRSPLPGLTYRHLDVFTQMPYSGNSVAVFLDCAGLDTSQMRRVTQEMRHFESIFLEPMRAERTVRARVFDLSDELEFAGHPLLGAASALHERYGGDGEQVWTLVLSTRSVQVATAWRNPYYAAVLDQGSPEFLGTISPERAAGFAGALNLAADDLAPGLPLAVVSTGLRYLIVPVRRGLERAHIVQHGFEAMLATVGAQFVYVVDVEALEGRHWTNDGLIEDVATGSGAGTAGAYLVRHMRIPPGHEFSLHQGRFTGRPSQVRVCVNGRPDAIGSVLVGGDVAVVGGGTLVSLPT